MQEGSLAPPPPQPPYQGHTVPARQWDLTMSQTLTLTMYSMRLWECFSITDSIQIRGFTCGVKEEGAPTCCHLTSLMLLRESRPDKAPFFQETSV